MNDTIPNVEAPLFIMGVVLSIILLVSIGIPYLLRLPLRRYATLRPAAGTEPAEAVPDLLGYLKGVLARQGYEAFDDPAASEGALVCRKESDVFRVWLVPGEDVIGLSYEMEGMSSEEIESGKLSCVMGSGVAYFGLLLHEAFSGLELAEAPTWRRRVGGDEAPTPLPKKHSRIVRMSPWR